MKNSKVIIGTGVTTFFFGFGAGALLNVYLFWIQSPLVLELRSSLNYTSAIIGDGILLPIINMIVVAFLLTHKNLITKRLLYQALLLGVLITMYFHISQAVNGLVNWAMPKPWQWNVLGVWHAIYMFLVCSLLSLFLLTIVKFVRIHRSMPKEAWIVSGGVIVFLILLRMDYMTVNISSIIPKF